MNLSSPKNRSLISLRPSANVAIYTRHVEWKAFDVTSLSSGDLIFQGKNHIHAKKVTSKWRYIRGFSRDMSCVNRKVCARPYGSLVIGVWKFWPPNLGGTTCRTDPKLWKAIEGNMNLWSPKKQIVNISYSSLVIGIRKFWPPNSEETTVRTHAKLWKAIEGNMNLSSPKNRSLISHMVLL